MADIITGARVQSLWRFPVKSMQGEQLDRVELTECGIVGDRAYAVVDEVTGKVASAKHPRKWGALLDCSARFAAAPAAGAPAPPVVITLPDGAEIGSDDPGVHDRLSALLGRRVRLLSSAPKGLTLEELWPDVDGMAPEEFIEQTTIESDEPAETVSDVPMALAAPGTFFDLAALHLVTTSTLGRLAALEPGSRFDVRRYRPNIVVDTDGSGSGFVENGWAGRTIEVATARISVSIPTMRCVMTTMAQPGLEKDLGILRAAARHNRVEIPGFGTWACVGVYAQVAAPGAIAVGDPVAVV